MTDKPIEWAVSSGSVVLAIRFEDACTPAHQGACDDDVAALRAQPYVKDQLDALDVETVAAEIREYGAWDETELVDHEANLLRLLWIACGDIRGNATELSDSDE